MNLAAIKLLRPHQWVKNGFCLAGLFFSGLIRDPSACLRALALTGVFCVASSAVYVWNDLQDLERDRAHPRKKLRPLPSGAIRPEAAWAILGLLALIVAVSSFRLDRATVITLWLYVVINVGYSISWKHWPILDVCCIAAGFVLRLLAGVFVIGELPTAWAALCTLFLALFLSFCKRRSELAAVGEGAGGGQRPVLEQYSLPLLDALINVTATLSVMSYALFTVLSHKNPSLVMTLPFVLFGIMHYQLLVLQRGGTEEPERILVKDRMLQLCVVLWLLLYYCIIEFDVRLFR